MNTYIYARHHESYDKYNAIKIGVTDNIPERDAQYATGEVVRGVFVLVIEIASRVREFVDNYLKIQFVEQNIRNDGGTEFYQSNVCDKITSELDKVNVVYRVLNQDEIDSLIRKNRDYETKHAHNAEIIDIDDINDTNNTNDTNNDISCYCVDTDIDNIDNEYVCDDIDNSSNTMTIQPNLHQSEVLANVVEFYSTADKGRLIWSCGLGKALMSLFIVATLQYNKICIGVPSVFLSYQFEHEIYKVFPKSVVLMLNKNSQYTVNDIALKIHNVTAPIFVITTYNSCHKLAAHDSIEFDFKIADEAHHLVGSRMADNTFTQFHNIRSTKSLFMTATERVIGNTINSQYYSMDDESKFGAIIDSKSVKWAIDNKKITDYTLTILKNNMQQVDDIIASCGMGGISDEHKELFISAYMSLLCLLGKHDAYAGLTHILIYCNKIENAERVDGFIGKLMSSGIFEFDGLYHKHTDKDINLEVELVKFKHAKKGIISCVYKLGEGVDIKYLNGVVFAENMSSEVRIVQSALRPNRLNADDPNKIAYLIVPYIEDIIGHANANDRYNSFEKIRNIVAKLSNVDESFAQRMRMCKVCGGINDIDDNDNTADVARKNMRQPLVIGDLYDDNELENIKLKLMFNKSLRTDLDKYESENRIEYLYVRNLNRIYGFESKQDYLQSRETHEHYVDDPENYFTGSNSWKNWYDFLGVDTTVFACDISEWKKICDIHGIRTTAEYNIKYNVDPRLPRNPGDLYDDFINVDYSLGIRNRR